jgi:FtsP/CotA-like multicopper oxidase with cupredoxin domain
MTYDPTAFRAVFFILQNFLFKMNRKQRPMMKRVANIFCIALIVLLAMTSATAIAETDAGTGDGSGGGTDIAFALVEANPQNGATGVNVSSSIWLLFNKNVVNVAVRDINKANIILRDLDGDRVSAAVTMKDDQIEPEYRREIVVVPSDPLDPGTTYKLTIGSAMQAKNGDTLGTTYTVTFTTAGENPNGQQSGTIDPTIQDGDTANEGNSSGNDSNTESLPDGTDSSNGSTEKDRIAEKTAWIALLLLCIVALGGATAAYIIISKRNKKINL